MVMLEGTRLPLECNAPAFHLFILLCCSPNMTAFSRKIGQPDKTGVESSQPNKGSASHILHSRGAR